MTAQEAVETIKYASAFNREDSPLTVALDIAIEALEKQSKLERVIERLEEESNFFRGEPMGALQKAYYCMGVEKAIEIIKEELM